MNIRITSSANSIRNTAHNHSRLLNPFYHTHPLLHYNLATSPIFLIRQTNMAVVDHCFLLEVVVDVANVLILLA